MYSSVLVRGTCFLPSGAVVVKRNLTVMSGALLDAATPVNPAATGADGLPGTLKVRGDVLVDPGGVLLFGCDGANGCPNGTTMGADSVGGNLTGIGALGVVVHSVRIDGNAVLFGGGGGAALVDGSGSGTCDGNPATNTPAPVPPLWASAPSLANGEGPGHPLPVFSDFEDNSIGGNLVVVGLQSCWFGALRNHVADNAVVAFNRMGDPDANEVMTNTIDASFLCFGNDHAVQFGDSGGSSNVVGRHAFGECGFDIRIPNGDGGPLTAVSVHAT
ncbi:MAG: hypothetical protein JST64_04540 [Actinobacteria bacterium]|nr:hypothetical protein [Actinomycetota bacterium]